MSLVVGCDEVGVFQIATVGVGRHSIGCVISGRYQDSRGPGGGEIVGQLYLASAYFLSTERDLVCSPSVNYMIGYTFQTLSDFVMFRT